MASQPTPEEIRRVEFRSALRGIDRAEVVEYLDVVASRIEQLEVEASRLRAQVGDGAPQDLESEFDVIGQEVTNILQAAREAAEAMRDRASADAARWRSEAMAEAEDNRRTAAADAEALRRDAWAQGSDLLQSAAREADRIKQQSERDVLTVMGEAEREAHRLTSGARREAEDVVRSASMDAEKVKSEAAKRRDDMIEAASRQASAAQERTRALEQRRDELLDELENVRTTLTRLEGSLEEKRESLDLSAESATVKVVQPPPLEDDHWALGETVRLVPTAKAQPSIEPFPAADELPPAEEAPSVDDVEEVGEPEPAPEPEPDSASEAEEPKTDDVGALFASLRSGGISYSEEAEEEPEADAVVDEDRPVGESVDWIEVREARLLPITNRALRGTKKAMTELQNIALDYLRTDEDWRPDETTITRTVQAELIGVWAESYAAGHAVAEEMTGSKLKRPPTPSSKAASEFAAALSEDVADALDSAGKGQRERQSAASKVFRVWRTDEAERRIREMAIHSYERAIETSTHVDQV